VLEVQLKTKAAEVSALIETLEVEKAKTNAIKEVKFNNLLQLK